MNLPAQALAPAPAVRAPEGKGPAIQFEARHYLARDGEPARGIYRLLQGWAYRFELDNSGKRQITCFFLPGDYCEPEWLVHRVVAQPVIAASTVRAQLYADLDARDPRDLEAQPLIEAMARNYRRLSAWTFSLGQLCAAGRIGHLFLDLFDRLRAVNLVYGDQCVIPLTQVELADATGLTPVHVNRVLQQMRSKGWLLFQNKCLRIVDRRALEQLAGVPEKFRLAALPH